MRILYFAPHSLGPLTSGGRLRDYHLARELARYAEVTFLELQTDTAKASDLPDTTPFARCLSLHRPRAYTLWKIIRGMLGPQSLTALNYGSAALRSQLRRALAGLFFDSIQLENVHLLSFVPVLRQLFPTVPVIADWHNVESELMLRYADRWKHPARKLVAWRTAQLLAHEEQQLLHACNAHTVPSEREREQLHRRYPEAPIHVVPNGVATANFRLEETSSKDVEGRRLLFVGSMDYHANIDAVQWFVQEVWPQLISLYPTAKFTIVGRNPPRSIQQLAGAAITVTGDVKKVEPFYYSADIVVVPLRVGSGTRLKIVEAMAAGVPVISTSLGAEGLNLENGKHFLQADGAEEMTRAIHVLFNDKGQGERLASMAKTYVNEHYDWGVIGKSLWQIHASIGSEAKAGAK